MESNYRIIQAPLITEKSTTQRSTENKYSFRVDKRASKIEIGKAVETLFKVKVVKVNTMIVKGKKKRMGAHEGMTPDWKKAIVTLKKGDTISSFEGT
ncbi:MAG: 50S ribosomal protein L23 [bacterium]